MRSLVIFGITAVFIACAFVPPSEANFQALAEHAKVAIEKGSVSSFFTVSLPDTNEWKKAAKSLQTLTKDAATTVLVENVTSNVKGQIASGALQTATNMLKDIVPEPATVAKAVVNQVTATVSSQVSKRWTELLSSEKDPALAKIYERIDWAAKKGEVRLCRELTLGVSTETIAAGDLLALCLAKVTRDPARCEQISDDASVLKSICKEELAIESDAWSGLMPV